MNLPQIILGESVMLCAIVGMAVGIWHWYRRAEESGWQYDSTKAMARPFAPADTITGLLWVCVWVAFVLGAFPHGHSDAVTLSIDQIPVRVLSWTAAFGLPGLLCLLAWLMRVAGLVLMSVSAASGLVSNPGPMIAGAINWHAQMSLTAFVILLWLRYYRLVWLYTRRAGKRIRT